MPLRNTIELIGKYGQKLINGTIVDDELRALLDPRLFTSSPGHPNPNTPVTESNHTVLDAIKDFTLAMAPQLDEDKLHNLTAKLIELAPQGNTNTFLRNSTLEKCFLTYEMAHYAEIAERHFESERMRKEFPGKDYSSLRECILRPLIAFFKNPEVRFNATNLSENHSSMFNAPNNFVKLANHPETITNLNKFIFHYWLASGMEKISRNNIMPDGQHRAKKKYHIGKGLLEAINNDPDKILITFELLLRTNQLAREDFFSGRTEDFLSPEFALFLKAEPTPMATS